MLLELRIRNLAIIEAVTLPVARGFNVLSGETGAGKSIIVGALGLLLGERGSADAIRPGCDRASVEGTFDAADSPRALGLLDARGIEVEGAQIVLKREISSGGRTRAWINGSPVTASQLADVGRLLVNLHGQHESQALLHPDAQLSILDAFAGATELAQSVRERHAALLRVRAEIASLRARRLDAERRADYLRHVVREIEDAAPHPGEETKLDEEIRRLAHVEELRGQVEQMREALDGEESAVLSLLAAIRRHLAAAERIDPSLGRLDELIEGATYPLDELSRELQEYDSALDADPARLSELERRRDTLFRLTSKYGPTVEDVIETLGRSRGELELVDTAELDLRSLGAQETAAQAALAAESRKLSEQRGAASARLAGAVMKLFPDLGMSEGKFEAALVPLVETGPAGAEGVEFRVSLNAGHEPRALARVASGGELSRVMLAMKSILARLDETPTLVFDEVDAGIGGRVALKVGDAMRRLAAHHQVVAITHIAQIAARAHHHIVVSKGARDGVTTADIEVAAGEGRVTELARMLGGDPHSDVSRAHARELQAAAAERSAVSETASESGRPAKRRAR